MNSTAQDEITEYVERVRAALADLPEATRAELLEDLPEHLAEIRAEDTLTLSDRLGTPEAYAAELRATTDAFVGGYPEPPKRRFAPLLDARADVERVLGRVDVKIGPLIGYVKASEFLILLRPAWWVLRGYLAAMAIAFFLDAGGQPIGLLPRIGNSTVVALLLLAGLVIASILLGQRGLRLVKWQRHALHGGTAVLILFAIGGFLNADSSVRDLDYQDAGYSGGGNPYEYVQDVFVYDDQGRLVPGARLFDQDGSPIQLGDAYCSDQATGEVLHTRSMGYPFCPENAPFASPTTTPTPDASAPSSATSSPAPATSSAASSKEPVDRMPSASPPTR